MLAVQEGDGLGVENEGWISTGEDESLRFPSISSFCPSRGCKLSFV